MITEITVIYLHSYLSFISGCSKDLRKNILYFSECQMSGKNMNLNTIDKIISLFIGGVIGTIATIDQKFKFDLAYQALGKLANNMIDGKQYLYWSGGDYYLGKFLWDRIIIEPAVIGHGIIDPADSEFQYIILAGEIVDKSLHNSYQILTTGPPPWQGMLIAALIAGISGGLGTYLILKGWRYFQQRRLHQ